MPIEAPADVAALSYEQARDELVQVVQRLEQGSPTLEDSLALWERGEALARRCEEWLLGAKARLDAARSGASNEHGAARSGAPDEHDAAPSGAPDKGSAARSGASDEHGAGREAAPDEHGVGTAAASPDRSAP